MNKNINQLLDWEPSSSLKSLPLVSADKHRSGMRYFAAGVSIISSGNEKTRAGLTATAVCSVTADPPRLVVFVNKNVQASETILETGALCINLLADDQEQEAKVFAGMVDGIRGEERFKQGNWTTMTTGVPTLDNALANFDCRVVKVFDESTHYAFLCEVLATRERKEGAVLIYLNGSFKQLPLL